MVLPVVSLSGQGVICGCIRVLQGKVYLNVNDQVEAKLAQVSMVPKLSMPSGSSFQEQHFDIKVKFGGDMTRKVLTFS